MRKTQQLVKLAANKNCDGTECPGGCCVGHYDWVCCQTSDYCAATPDLCSYEARGLKKYHQIYVLDLTITFKIPLLVRYFKDIPRPKNK